MKKLIAFVVLYSLFVILLCPGIDAQWEGAEVQQLTYNNLRNKIIGLYIGEDEEVLLFYQQIGFDSLSWTARDTLFVMTKEKGGEWSQPEKIGNPSFGIGLGYETHLGYDTNTGVTHIFYTSGSYLGCAETLYYTNSNVCNWEVTKVDSLEELLEDYECIDMAFDSLGNVHLVWTNHCGGWVKFMYMNNSTGEWVKQQVSEPIWVGLGWAHPAMLAIQKDGTAHIVHGGGPRDMLIIYYVRNDSLKDTNWIVDTVPKPPVSFYSYEVREIMADDNDKIHLFTGGGEDWEYMTGYFDFYYYKQGRDSVWIGPDSTYQPEPDKLAFGYLGLSDGAFIDAQGDVHAVLVEMGLMVTTPNYFYTNNKQGSWLEPYQILYPEPYWPSRFRFVIDSEGQGHGVFEGSEENSPIYYLSPDASGVEDEADPDTRLTFHLFQNYPNPFNTSTVINYELKEDCHVRLNIYNLLGQKLRTLENQVRSKGLHSITWDGKDINRNKVTTGIYFYQLTVRQAHRPEQSRGRAGDYRDTKKLVLVK
ncbi:MAG: T9SS type A sorting domain-containing protein [Candidatus Zixiibacteriota bacterium]